MLHTPKYTKTPKHIKTYREERENYPALSRAAEIMPPPPAAIIGRDLNELRRGLRNPEKANVALLAEAGTGKTAYVQGFAYDEESLLYYLVLNVNPERLIEKTGDRDNALLTGFNELLDEAGQYSEDHDVIVVLFVDEFHKIMQISPSLMESLKPRLEKSAINGFRLIAATTFQEYNETVAQNRPLDQRFLQIKLAELSKDAVIRVLENRAKQHGVYDLLDKDVLNDIYTESRRLLMSNAQPRASIDILNSMIGDIVKKEYMENGQLKKEYFTPSELGFVTDKALSRPLLKRVIKRTQGVDIDNTVDVRTVIEALKTRLFNQENAIEMVVRLLEAAAQGYSELTRPKFSFLSTGTTGTGKSLPDTELIPAPVENGYIKNGELKPGDFVYGAHGKPIRVTGVFPQGERTIFRVYLEDGRRMDCARDHLWTVRDSAGGDWETLRTEDLMRKVQERNQTPKPSRTPYCIPRNEAVEREARRYKIDPYVMGAALGNGSFRDHRFVFSCTDGEIAERMGNIMNFPVIRNPRNVSWFFVTGSYRKFRKVLSTDEFLEEAPDLVGRTAAQKFIPKAYKYGSVEQRWALIQGLFDTDGILEGGTLTFVTLAPRLARDVQEVLWSLGIPSAYSSYEIRRKARHKETREYKLTILADAGQLPEFFRLTRKRRQAEETARQTNGQGEAFDGIAIRDVQTLRKKVPMTCIMVDDPDHLYLAGKAHIVTHNTEMAKIISESMNIPLKRFDMSRYGDPAMAKEFGDALFQAAWSTPNAYILIDEVEKSSKRAMNILLQVLDDARLTDSMNPDRIASFTGCIINLTTNVGSEVYQNEHRFKSGSVESDIELVYKALTNAQDSDGNPLFETAVLGRIDEIVPFHPLPTEAMEKIVKRTINEALETGQTHKRRILVSEDIVPYIVKDRTSSDTERGGARDAKRNVRNLIIQPLAHYQTYAKQEVPIIIYLKGRPRFKYTDVADPLNAQVAIQECYSVDAVENLLNQLSAKTNKPIINKGLFFPLSRPFEFYAKEIVTLIGKGCFQFYTEMDGEEAVIKGV